MVLEGGNKTNTKTAATSLAPSLSKDEILAIYGNTSPVSKQLQKHLNDDDRVFFHSEGKIDRTFRLFAILAVNSVFIFCLIAAICYLATIGGAWEGETTRGLVFLALALIAFPSYVVVLMFLPFRNHVILTQSTLFTIKTRLLILFPSVFADPISLISKISCTTVIESRDRSAMNDENVDRIANENSHLQAEGLFYVSKGGSGHTFIVSNANDLIDNLTRVFDSAPTRIIRSQKSEYVKRVIAVLLVYSTTYFFICLIYYFGSDISFDLMIFFYFLCCAIFVVYAVVLAFLKRNKYEIHHTFDFSR